jgi:hypothetical protein
MYNEHDWPLKTVSIEEYHSLFVAHAKVLGLVTRRINYGDIDEYSAYPYHYSMSTATCDDPLIFPHGTSVRFSAVDGDKDIITVEHYAAGNLNVSYITLQHFLNITVDDIDNIISTLVAGYSRIKAIEVDLKTEKLRELVRVWDMWEDLLHR